MAVQQRQQPHQTENQGVQVEVPEQGQEDTEGIIGNPGKV